MKILIMGDSWAADWSQKHSEYLGWPNILAEQYDVTNIAQAGVSQYSIVRQLDTVRPLEYDRVICSITSPYRVYTPRHPVHTEGLHVDSDLIYTDIEYHSTGRPNNSRLQSAKQYFEHHFDRTHAEFVNELIVEHILSQLDTNDTVITSNIQGNDQLVTEHIYCDGHGIWQSYPGKINHLSEEGNQLFADSINTLLN